MADGPSRRLPQAAFLRTKQMIHYSQNDGRVIFAGEILDLHGDCGGYNLNWAWQSGQFAGKMPLNMLYRNEVKTID